MGLFRDATNDQAYFKAGLMGLTGSGKTYTSVLLAIGLHQYLKEHNQPEGSNPIMFLDTETGSDWVRDMFDEAGIKLLVRRASRCDASRCHCSSGIVVSSSTTTMKPGQLGRTSSRTWRRLTSRHPVRLFRRTRMSLTFIKTNQWWLPRAQK